MSLGTFGSLFCHFIKIRRAVHLRALYRVLGTYCNNIRIFLPIGKGYALSGDKVLGASVLYALW